jgi:hypothetical protein
MKLIIDAVAAFVASVAPVNADAVPFAGMQNDPALLRAIGEMTSLLEPGCYNGAPAACEAYHRIAGNAQGMAEASRACEAGQAVGCASYLQFYRLMDTDYAAYLRGVQMNAGGWNAPQPGNPLGSTHEDRMRAIENFGQVNADEFRRRMDEMDRSQGNFLGTIR